MIEELTLKGIIESIPDSSGATSRPLIVESAIFRTQTPAGKPYTGEMINIYDETSGLYYWWLRGGVDHESTKSWYQRTDRIDSIRRNNSVHIGADEMLTLLKHISVRGFWAVHSTQKASSIREAQRQTLAQVPDFVNRWQIGDESPAKRVLLRGHLPSKFFDDSYSAAAPNRMIFRSVTAVDEGWKITIEGQSELWAKVTLDRSLSLSSVELIESLVCSGES